MSAISVSYPFRDKDGQYEVSATVHSNGYVHIYDIRTEEGDVADIDDWSPSERGLMKGLAMKAAKELDKEPDDEYDTDILDDEEWEQN